MTVYTRRKRLINFIIIVLMVATGTANLFISNSVASRHFAVDLKKKELHAIGNALAVQEAVLNGGTSGMANLLLAVQHNGMVPGAQGDTLFLNTGVAYINGSAQGQN